MEETSPQTNGSEGAVARLGTSLRALWAQAAPQVRALTVSATSFGSAPNMAAASLLGALAFLVTLVAAPPEPAAAASQPTRSIQAPAPSGPLQDVSISVPAVTGDMAPAPMGAPPPPAVQTVLDYDVVFYWPATPQTVTDAVAIREGPAGYARVLRQARPGERLRINGKVEGAPGGPWYRVRLAEGGDGYFAARTVDVAGYRRARKAQTVEVAATGDGPAVIDPFGAPLMAPTVSEESEIGPPSF
jgi:hypothetical protein